MVFTSVLMDDEMSGTRGGVRTRYDETVATGDDPNRTASNATDGLPLLPDEEVLIDAKPTWCAWATHLGFAGVVAAAGLLLAFAETAVGIATVSVGAVVAGYVWYRRNRVRYLVTDRRTVVVSGFFSRTTTETWMEDVRGMQTSASRFERRQGYGTNTVSHGVIPAGFVRIGGL